MALPNQLFPWDDYFPRMAEADWLAGRSDIMSAKTFFIRQAPFGGSYAVLGGIIDALRQIDKLRFYADGFIDGMLDMGYRPDFIDWLVKRDKLKVQVYAPLEGTLIFPNEPAVTVVGALPDIRLVEGILTEALNFATLALTKWHRLVWTVRPGQVMDFSRRRSQNTYKSTISAILAGCSSTSNSEMRRFIDCRVSGTMGHEWVQSFGDVAMAFDTWLTVQPRKAIGLVDTLQCMKHDFPLWLNAVYKHRERIKEADPVIWGWRNDSGDLAKLSIDQWTLFLKHPLAQDPWFVERCHIILTNDLDEYAAEDIIWQINKQLGFEDAGQILSKIIWAAGTKPGTCFDQPSLGGVAKLVEVEGSACIKLAFDSYGHPSIKTSIPGFNLSSLIYNYNENNPLGLLIYPINEYGPANDMTNISKVPLEGFPVDNKNLSLNLAQYKMKRRQSLVFDSLSEKPVLVSEKWKDVEIDEVPKYIASQVSDLSWEMTRLEKPQEMPVYLTPDLWHLRKEMIDTNSLIEK